MLRYYAHGITVKELPLLREDAIFHPSVTPTRIHLTDENNIGLDVADLGGHLAAARWRRIWNTSQPTILVMNYLLRYIQPQGSEALILRDSFRAGAYIDEIAAVKVVAYEAAGIGDDRENRREHRLLRTVQYLLFHGLIIEIAEFWHGIFRENARPAVFSALRNIYTEQSALRLKKEELFHEGVRGAIAPHQNLADFGKL
jgi:hypothetical protein